jgi:GAF domain-containing protein/HAMP domain-containing protein
MKIPGSGGRLFRKYVVVLLVLVGGVLMASSLVELYFSYRETQRAILRVERAKAMAAAVGIEQFLKEVEQQVRETTRTASDDPDASQVGQGRLGFRQGLGAALAEQRELDFLRVLRNVPAVSQLSHLDLAGKEQLRVSRLDPDVVGSQEDFSQTPKFVQARAGKTFWSPVYFKNDSEPYVTLAVPLGKYALEVTTAEIGLGAVLKAVSQIDVGPDGYAYVVDSRNQLVAHPDSRILREKRDVSALVQVKSARAERSGLTADAPVAVVADSLGGGRVLAAHAAIAPLGWLVFVERPAADAYAPLRAPIIRSVVIFVLGVGLSVLASLFLARRMVAPIRILQEGAARIGAGTLDQPIELHTGDEIEVLAGTFNRMTASLKESYEGLEQKVEARTRELAGANRDLTEALEQQTATSEILRVISSSPIDVQPVFDAIVRSAMRLLGGFSATLRQLAGDQLDLVAFSTTSESGDEALQSLSQLSLAHDPLFAQVVRDRAPCFASDTDTDPRVGSRRREVARARGYRSMLVVPMLREGGVAGTITVTRLEPGPFTDSHIDLLQTFADQAVIAIENVRLFKELEARNRDLTESLQQQTATSEILRVISQSPTDLQPVLDTVAANAARLCESADAQIFQIDGHALRPAAWFGSLPKTAAEETRPISRGSVNGRAVVERRTIHIHDLAAESETEWPEATAFQKRFGHRSIVATPLLREGTPIGAISIRRMEVRPFSDQQIKLLETFADQAVIAIENVRLFKELEARNRDLTEALEQQTATSEILRVISSSPTEIEPVLDALVKSATRFCGAYDAVIFLPEGDSLRVGAHHGPILNPVGLLVPLVHGTVAGRALLERQAVHVADLQAEAHEFPEGSALARQLGHRTTLSVPLMRESAAIGVIQLRRNEVNPFSAKQMALLQTFANQAVIAIENVRLFKELEARNRDLTEALEQQTATSEILRVISSSPTDIEPVLEALVKSATRFCGAYDAIILLSEGDSLRLGAHHGPIPNPIGLLVPAVPGTAAGRALLERRVFQVADLPAEVDEFPEGSAIARQYGYRTILSVPLLRENAAIGVIQLRRAEVNPFSDKQIALLQTFADQAVIAIENVRLFKELEARTAELTRSVEELRALGEVGRAVSGSLDIQSVLTSIVSHAVELSQTDAGTIYEFDESAQAFAPRASYGMTEELIEALRQSHIRVGEGAVGEAARTRAAFQIADLEREPHYALRFLIEAGYRALLAVPLLSEDRVIGGLVVRRKAAGMFPKPIVDLLQTFATQSVIAIQNARLFREIDEKSRALEELSRNQEQLSRLSTALQEPLSLSEQLTRVLDAARQVVGLDHLYIWTPSPAADGFMVSAGAGLSEGDWRDLVGVTIPLGEAGALAAVYRDGEPMLFSEAHPLPEKYRLRVPYSAIPALRLKAFLVSPMIARGRTVGVLSADNRVSRAPIPAHTVDLLHSFAAQAAVAVENARLFQEIQEKSQQLELASKHKSQFLANMSHELRTPMNAVLGYTDLILDDIFGDVPAPIRETLERIKTNGHHLLSLINDVLDLSKMEAGQLTLSIGDYAMGEVVHAVVSAVESLAAGKKLAFKAVVPADLPPGRGDERRLTQVLLNLAGNAIKFTDAGGVSIEAQVADGAFLVSVADTGPGIAEADQQKIFEEFQQADSSSTRTKGGSGLGLSISRRIVELHGGRLWVESAPGKGSTFYFTVPLRVERPAERA